MTKPSSSQPDLFISAIADAPFRDGLDLMSVPIVGLSKTPRTDPIMFTRGDTEIEVSAPAHIGLATIWDFDLVLWAISQLALTARTGGDVGTTIQTPAYDILKAIRRGTGGKDYASLRQALDRLVATTVRTNLRTKRGRRWETFHLLEHVAWTETDDGAVRGVSITVPEWLHRAVVDGRILALDARYFQLTGGLARWLYRVVRKQAGDQQTGWRWPMAELYHRSGITRPMRNFASDLRRLVEANDLPEYWLEIYTDKSGGECLHAVRRSKLALDHPGRESPIRRNVRDPAL